MKGLFKSFAVISLLVFFSTGLSFGAISPNDFDKRIKKVRDLFEQNMYIAAQHEIESIKSDFVQIDQLDESELEGYALLCNIILEKPNMDALIMDFENKYQNTPELAKAKFLQSSYYFKNKNYEKSMRIMKKIEYSFLSKDDKLEFLFNRSFALLKLGKIKEAGNGFNELRSLKRNRFTVQATYYSGYIAYLNKDFKTAASLLQSIENDDYFGHLCKYYMLESHLMLKDYQYVIDNGSFVAAAVDANMRPRVARIISDAYFETDNSKEAKEWFEKYSVSISDLSRKDNYYLGLLSYSLDSYRPAIDAFAKVISQNDSLTQSALYHTGNAFLNLKNKIDACSSFKRASEMNFDLKIKEEAFFNYAKLSFDINNDINAFGSYLETYPQSERADEIYVYVANSYLVSKQYKDAITVLEKIKHPYPSIIRNLQKAAFLRGMELLDRGVFTGASSAFRISLKHSTYNNSLMLLTKFWLAEAEYRSGHFSESLKINLSLYDLSKFKSTAEYPLLLFNIGYCYFRLEDYVNSIDFFRRFLEISYSDMNLILESKIRMADGYFILKDYEKSASLYEEVSAVDYKTSAIVYAAYHSAISYGLLGDMEKKIEILKSIYNKNESSPLYPVAVYELGRSYVESDMTENAESIFEYLIEEMRDPVYKSKAMLELGMLYSNMGKYQRALDILTQIVEKMPMSEERANALAVMESIYSLQNRPEEYLAYIDRVGLSETKNADQREIMMFNAAEQLFLSGNMSGANKSLDNFIKNYPESEKIPQAYFYLAETLLGIGKKEAAAEAYIVVIENGKGSFVELSTLRYAEICYGMEQYEKAATAYQTLLSIAQLDNNKHLAMVGIMRAYYNADRYLNAIDAANALLATKTGKAQNELEAEYIVAKSYIALGRRDEAKPILKKISALNMTPEGAEATYLLITDSYDSGNFTEVENMVYAFSESESDQTYWIAKSFIVLGDTFAERGEWEQAEATFNSVKDGYVPAGSKDDILEQAELRLSKIKQFKESEEREGKDYD